MNLSIILIPSWVEQSLKAANLPLSAALDVEKLSNILSKEDVSFYCYSNPILLQQLYPGVFSEFPIVGLNCEDATIQRKLNDLASANIPLTRENAYGTSYAMPVDQSNNGSTPPTVDLFNLVELTERIIAVIPVQVSAKDVDINILYKECYNRAIGFFHRFGSLSSISSTNLFKKYTELAFATSRTA